MSSKSAKANKSSVSSTASKLTTKTNPENQELTLIRSLATISKESDLSEIEYEKGGVRILIKRGMVHAPQNFVSPTYVERQQSPMQTVNTEVAKTQNENNAEKEIDLSTHRGVINSPMVGILYTRAKPDSDDYVKVGSKVKEGDTVLLIESMKVFNPIKSPISGTVVKILVQNGTPIEFGAPLLIIE